METVCLLGCCSVKAQASLHLQPVYSFALRLSSRTGNGKRSAGWQLSWKTEPLGKRAASLSHALENKVMFLCFKSSSFSRCFKLHYASSCLIQTKLKPDIRICETTQRTFTVFCFRFHCERCVCTRIWRFLCNRFLRGTSGFFFFFADSMRNSLQTSFTRHLQPIRSIM